jgi:hypothetical protein
MAELPPGMHQGEKHPLPHFDKDEYLYRRVPPILWDDEADDLPIDVDALEMPDMSVGRSRLAHPEWLRLASGCDDWAVVGFRTEDIPPERWIDGIPYAFRPEHVPLRHNYPHAEVRAYERATGVHMDGKAVMLPERVHLEWRERLLRKVRVFLTPGQPAKIRQHNPVSHVPELPIPAE